MTILKILTYPNKNLRKIAKPVKEINLKIKKIIHDMIKTMHFNNGIGLAATQVNIPLKIIVITENINNNKVMVFINPKIIEKSEFIRSKEGCLSIPNYEFFIKRYKYIKMQALNILGQTIIIETDSLLSICIQHEIDHLNGILFIDYLSSLQKEILNKKIIKLQKLSTKI
ncbi:peptide deformylase [Buchnera aphidicola (Kurisakia onigurumii)]|uniref:peptide deformylase n=1 Tax=Buchnera aphidicola TaxID=9 RepID=UPI0031B67C5B